MFTPPPPPRKAFIMFSESKQCESIRVELEYMKSLIPKGAKSNFVTSEKNTFLCGVFVHASMGNSILNLQYLLFASDFRIRNAF